MPETTASIVPGSRRTFAGLEYELAGAPDGYVFKQDSHVLHAPTCLHEPTNHVTSWSADQALQAWLAAPDVPLIEVTAPRFCSTCLARPVRSEPQAGEHHNAEQIAEVAAAARVVLDHLFGDGQSVIDPSATIWAASTAESLRAAIEDSLDEGAGTVFEKLRNQLAGQPREVVLLAAELVYLRGVPLINLNPSTKVEHLTKVLSTLTDPPAIPEAMLVGAENGGCFHGGQGYNQQLWKHIVWLAKFVSRWTSLSPSERATALESPWAFRRIAVDSDVDVPGIRNAFLFLVFPNVFENIVNDGHKADIRRTFSYLIDGATGDDAESIDRDLLTIRTRVEEREGERISWYRTPWDEWQKKPATSGDRAWAVRATRSEGKALAEQWIADGFVSLAADHLGEVPAGAALAVVRSAVALGYDHRDYPQQFQLVHDYFAFLSRMKDGDAIIARTDDDAWIGRIEGDPYYAAEAPRLRRDVEWQSAPQSIAALPAPLPSLLEESGTVLDLTGGREALDAILDGPTNAGEGVDPSSSSAVRVTLASATPDLATSLHMPQEWLDDVITTLDSRQQIVLYGPPGTGKTYTARAVAKHVAGDAVQIVQFHPSYAYEDFFEGFRPAEQADGGLSFTLRPGPLRRIAAMAAADPTVPWVLIIDEINRGNIAKIFGELYFLLEYREASISLQYSSDKPFSLPSNLYFIGTMNTADRSIAMVDAAIRRRFAFMELHPDSAPVDGLLERWLKTHLKEAERGALLRSLNSALGEKNRDFQIGPSYLMRPEAEHEGGLERIWRFDILPLLEEQFYGHLTPAQVSERYGLAAIRKRPTGVSDLVFGGDEIEVRSGEGGNHASGDSATPSGA